MNFRTGPSLAIGTTRMNQIEGLCQRRFRRTPIACQRNQRSICICRRVEMDSYACRIHQSSFSQRRTFCPLWKLRTVSFRHVDFLGPNRPLNSMRDTNSKVPHHNAKGLIFRFVRGRMYKGYVSGPKSRSIRSHVHTNFVTYKLSQCCGVEDGHQAREVS